MVTADAPATTEETLTPAVFQNGGAFRAQLKRGDVVVWSCPHLHFTDHSAKACAERHLAEIAGHVEGARGGG